MKNWESLRCFFIAALAATVLACPVASAAPMPILAVTTIDEMPAQSGDATRALQVLSYHAGLNRGGGLFVWTPSSTATPDNCVTFAGKGAAGRWTRQWTGPLEATMCGAYWDDIHDDAAVLTHAFAVASALHLSLNFPGGTTKVCSTVTAAPAVIVRGQGMANGPSPTTIDGSCMKTGWVFELTTPHGAMVVEAPKYYDMEIRTASTQNPGGGAFDGTRSRVASPIHRNLNIT